MTPTAAASARWERPSSAARRRTIEHDEPERPESQEHDPAPKATTTYKVHELTISHQSLTDRKVREKLFLLLAEVAGVLDPTSRAGVQVATIKIELNAAEGSLDELGTKAADAGAEWRSFDEDF